MTRFVHGFVHGKTIELSEELGITEGQEVVVQVRLIEADKPWGEGIKRTAGALANDSEWDQIMEEIYANRKLDRKNAADLP